MPRCERCGASLSSATATCRTCGRAAPESLAPWARGAAPRTPGEVTPPPWDNSAAARPASTRAGAALRSPSLPPPVPPRAGGPTPTRGAAPAPPAFAVGAASPLPPRPARPVAAAAPSAASTGAAGPSAEQIDLPAGLRPARRGVLSSVGCAVAIAGIGVSTLVAVSGQKKARRPVMPEYVVMTPSARATAAEAPVPEAPGLRGRAKPQIEWTGKVVESSQPDLMGRPCTLGITANRFGTLPPRLDCGDTQIRLPRAKVRINEWVGVAAAPAGAAPGATAAAAPSALAPPVDADAAPEAELLYHLELFDPTDEDTVIFQTGEGQPFEVEGGKVTVHLERFGHRRGELATAPLHGPAIYDPSPLSRELVVAATAPELRLPIGTRCRLETRLARFVSGGGWCIAELRCGQRMLYGQPGSVALGVNATDASWIPCTLDDATGRPLYLRDPAIAEVDGDPLLVGPIDGETLSFSETGDLDRAQLTLRVVEPADAGARAGDAPAAGGTPLPVAPPVPMPTRADAPEP